MSNFTANGTIVLGDRLKQCYDGETDSGGLRHGRGMYTYANAAFKYEGEYVKGEKHGKGRLTLSDGSYFEGTFERDEIVGHGTRVYSDGSRYEGLFLDGEATGQGVYSSAQGWTVHAQFANNRPIGQGKWENTAGDIYEGTFDGKFHGQGTMRCSNGYVYTGSWKGGKKHGQGIEELNGEVFTLQVLNDALGVDLALACEQPEEAQSRPLCKAAANWLFMDAANTMRMQGDFHDDHRHGTGTLRTADGRTYTEITFCNGEMLDMAGRLRLEYPKNVDKKGNELPVALEIGVRVPYEFSVHVAVETQVCNNSTPVADDMAQPETEADNWQLFAKESGRCITVRLYHGHPQHGEELQEQVPGDVLGTWSADNRSATADGGDSVGCADDSQAAEQLLMVPEVHISTDTGACCFSNFQIGGGSCEVAAGAYTLVFSSDGLADETVAVTVGAKGKGK